MKFILLPLFLNLIVNYNECYAAVFAEDDRQPHKSLHSGAVLCAEQNSKKVISIGTASLVTSKLAEENKVVLTNEHVIRNLKTGDDYDCWFAVNAELDKKVKLSDKRVYGGKFDSGQVFDDWAFAILETALPSEVAKALPISTSVDTSFGHDKYNFALNAYNSGTELNKEFTAEMTISKNCRVFMADESPLFKPHEYEELLVTDCDCYEGCSGAAIIDTSSQQISIKGVYFGSYFADKHYLGGSQRFTAFDLFRYVNAAVRIKQFHIEALNKLVKELQP